MKSLPRITTAQVADWLQLYHQVSGQLTPLVGDEDCNFMFQQGDEIWTVKISQDKTVETFVFEQALMCHLASNKLQDIQLPLPILNRDKQWLTVCETASGEQCLMRVLSWVEGDLWSNHAPHNNRLLHNLGQQAAELDQLLVHFECRVAKPEQAWDLAHALWIKSYFKELSAAKREVLVHFTALFEQHQHSYQQLRCQVIHNDLNDHNIVLNSNSVNGFIDFGDACKTQLINELAIVCAYALMDKPDPLAAAAAVVAGYHQVYPLEAAELLHLYHLIGMRLAVSVTQSHIAQQQHPDNDYKTVSEQAAWQLLDIWRKTPAQLAYFTFRHACGYSVHPKQKQLQLHLNDCALSLVDMFPEHTDKLGVLAVDLGVGSTLLGVAAGYENHAEQLFKMQQLQVQHPTEFLAGGYLEARSFYASDAFSFEGNSGKEYRTMHLGLDIWLPAQTTIQAPLAGKVVALKDHDRPRDYGPTIILEHSYAGGVFYTLYGHLSRSTLALHQLGDWLESGDLLAWVGASHENGGWSSHLHFQVIHDLLGFQDDFPGACRPVELPVMSALCPDPLSFFRVKSSGVVKQMENHELIDFRHQHLGKSLSLSYSEPIQMLRGDDVYLIDQYGQKYLDTCNNVAHVGHENPAVVRAGQQQMAVLNTNSRYLHPAVVAFTRSLLATLPEQLSVVHMVNSGSEANELALRMAKAYSDGKEVIALESGYHGNSNACIDISAYKFDGKGGQGAPDSTHIVPLPDTFRGLHRGADAASEYAGYVIKAIQSLQSQNRQLSAFIAESIVSCGGQIVPPDGYFSQVYKAVRAAGGVCIADEVQVGCGRIGSHFWAFEAHDVIPDIVTIGKPIGNGHPLAVVVCTREVADRFANGMEYFNTFGGNPVSARIGQAVLHELKTNNLQQNALQVGQYLQLKLQQLMRGFPIIKDIRGQGLFLGFELCDTDLQPLPKQAQYLADRMRELGVLISTDGPDHNVIKIKPPITFTQAHANELLIRLETVLKESMMQI